MEQKVTMLNLLGNEYMSYDAIEKIGCCLLCK